MDFLKRNSGKIALIAIIAFFTLPFIYSNEEEEDFSPFAVRSGMSYQSNPISKLANKIASFYGFSKPASGMVASSKGVDSIKEKVSENNFFTKENVPSSATASKTGKSKDDVLVASSKSYKKYDLNSSDFDTSKSRVYNSGNNPGYADSYGGSSTGYYGNNSNSPVKGYVTVNGQNYEVIEDIKGNRYVVTPKGHIPYEEVMRKMVSDKEFAAAKKRLAGASDMEVLAALQQEKERQAYQANGGKYQASADGYRNGNSTNMGGANYARVSTSDKGFDADALSNAYADLKNINVKIDTSSSGRGGASGSSARGNYYNNGSNEEQNLQEEQFVSPANIATQARTAVQQNARQVITDKNLEDMKAKQREMKTNVTSPSNNATENNDVPSSNISRKQKSIDTLSMPKIQNLIKNKNDEYELANTIATNIPFVADVKNSDIYSDWDRIELNGGNISGRILPKVVENGVKMPTLKDNFGIEIDYDKMEQNINSINSSIETIKNKIVELPPDVKVYVDLNACDEPSRQLIQNIMKVNMPDEGEISILTDNPEGENVISLPNFILTPTYFENGAQELLKQAENFKAENMPA